MSPIQLILCLIFGLCCVIGAGIKCYSLGFFIKTVGADQLGSYYAYTAILSVFLIFLALFLSKKIKPVPRYIAVHSIQAMIALIAIGSPSDHFRAQLLFITILGFGVMVVFSNWSLANLFITPFKSKRIFPHFSLATQIGSFAGALFAVASTLGIEGTHYLTGWLIIECVLVLLGFYLMTQETRTDSTQPKEVQPSRSLSLVLLVKSYKLFPHLTLWVFIWGIVNTAIHTLAGSTFDRSGTNLTMLYGILTLAGSLVGSFGSAFLYPGVLRWVGLSSILLLSSVTIFMFGTIYLLFDFFAIAIVLYLVLKSIKGSFTRTALSTKFGLYPSHERDRIRLLGDVLATSAGAGCVGLIFGLPHHLIPWILFSILILLVLVSFIAKKKYASEMLNFLSGDNAEERNNAIALFDLLDDPGGYAQVEEILKQPGDLSARINMLHTLGSLGSIKPASLILKLLDKSEPDPLKTASLIYFSNININKLDPFLRHQFFELLKDISKSESSNILRAMAVKLLVQTGPVKEMVDFILDRLKDEDNRVVANAIEGLNYVKYPGAINVLLPFLEHPENRIRANAIVALWKYKEIGLEVQRALSEMVQSKEANDAISGIWAIGEVKDTGHLDYLLKNIDHPDKGLQRGIPIALLKLGNSDHIDRVIDLILDEDTGQGINTCYLSLRIDEKTLNEEIIAGIYSRGEAAQQLAIERYSRCGGFCGEQLQLLAGSSNKFEFGYPATI